METKTESNAVSFVVELLCGETKNLVAQLCTIAELRTHDKVAFQDEGLHRQSGSYISYVSTALTRMMSAQDREKSLGALEQLYVRCFDAIAALEFIRRQSEDLNDTSLTKDIDHTLFTLRASVDKSLHGLNELKTTYKTDPGTVYRIEHRVQWIRNRLGISPKTSSTATTVERSLAEKGVVVQHSQPSKTSSKRTSDS